MWPKSSPAQPSPSPPRVERVGAMAPSLVEFQTADIVQNRKGETARLGSVRGTVECDAHLRFYRGRMVDIPLPDCSRKLGGELSKG